MPKKQVAEGTYGTVFCDDNKAYKYIDLSKYPDCIIASIIEIFCLRHLSHPHIVPLSSVQYRKGTLILEMPFVPHELTSYRKTGFSLRQILYYLIAAFAYMHDCGIQHRDIKPENILLTATGTPMIIDFSLSSFSPSSTSPMIQTYYYRAPEIFVGAESGKAGDVWALGATFYYLLFGHPINDSDSLTALQEQAKVAGLSTDDLAAFRKDYGEYELPDLTPTSGRRCGHELWPILSRMLSFHPAKRPSFRELLQDPLFEGLSAPYRKPVVANRQFLEAKLKAVCTPEITELLLSILCDEKLPTLSDEEKDAVISLLCGM